MGEFGVIIKTDERKTRILNRASSLSCEYEAKARVDAIRELCLIVARLEVELEEARA